jgi:hypothetical protein
LAGLPAGARRLAQQLLNEYDDGDPSALRTLRSYCLSCERLRALEDAPDADDRRLHRELRSHVALVRLLGLETRKG